MRGSYKGPKGSRYHTNQERLNQMKLKVLITIALPALASVASGQLIYDEVKVEVAPGVACPSSWTASSETVMSEPRFQVHVPVVLDCDAERMGL